MTELIAIILALLGGLGLGWLAKSKKGLKEKPEPVEEPKPTTYDDEDHRENEQAAADTDADAATDAAVDAVVGDILSERR